MNENQNENQHGQHGLSEPGMPSARDGAMPGEMSSSVEAPSNRRSESASDESESTARPARRERGFAAMDPQRQREIASEGGRAAHQKGTAHEFTSEEAARAGAKGGRARAANQANRMRMNQQSREL